MLAAVVADRPVRLITTDGYDTRTLAPRSALGPVMDRLATVSMGNETNLSGIARSLADDATGLIIVCGTTLSDEDTRLLNRGDLSRRVMSVDCSATERRPGTIPFGSGVKLNESWADAWAQELSSLGRSAARRVPAAPSGSTPVAPTDATASSPPSWWA